MVVKQFYSEIVRTENTSASAARKPVLHRRTAPMQPGTATEISRTVARVTWPGHTSFTDSCLRLNPPTLPTSFRSSSRADMSLPQSKLLCGSFASYDRKHYKTRLLKKTNQQKERNWVSKTEIITPKNNLNMNFWRETVFCFYQVKQNASVKKTDIYSFYSVIFVGFLISMWNVWLPVLYDHFQVWIVFF